MTGKSIAKDRSNMCSARGFTLIEVMFATAFFLSVMAVIFSMQSSARAMISTSRNYDLASSVLFDMGELMQVLSPQDLQTFMNSGVGQAYSRAGAVVAAGAADAFFFVTGQLVPGNDVYKQMALTIRWQDTSTAAQVRSITTNVLVKL